MEEPPCNRETATIWKMDESSEIPFNQPHHPARYDASDAHYPILTPSTGWRAWVRAPRSGDAVFSVGEQRRFPARGPGSTGQAAPGETVVKGLFQDTVPAAGRRAHPVRATRKGLPGGVHARVRCVFERVAATGRKRSASLAQHMTIFATNWWCRRAQGQAAAILHAAVILAFQNAHSNPARPVQRWLSSIVPKRNVSRVVLRAARDPPRCRFSPGVRMYPHQRPPMFGDGEDPGVQVPLVPL